VVFGVAFAWLALPVGLPPATAAPDEGPVVRRVVFDRQPIFSATDFERLPDLPLRLMDFLHVDTRTGFLRRELTFARGERITAADLEESARKLRGTGFLRDVGLVAVPVAPSAGPAAPTAGSEAPPDSTPGTPPLLREFPTGVDSVDVIVHTREVWTTSLGFRFESLEGSTFFSVWLSEGTSAIRSSSTRAGRPASSSAIPTTAP